MSRLITTTYRRKIPQFPYPGPSSLVGGDADAGYLGLTQTSELITGNALASSLGLSAGTAQYNTEPWLKFVLAGKILYIARKPFRRDISWNHINAVGAVFGTATVNIGGDLFKVRLVKGTNTDPFPHPAGDFGHDLPSTHQSEWNRLLYRVWDSVPASQEGPNWAEFTSQELYFSASQGHRAWCLERSSTGRGQLRQGTLMDASFGTSFAHSHTAWRPLLEPV